MSVYVIKLVRSAPRSGSIINYLGTTISPFGGAFLLQGGFVTRGFHVFQARQNWCSKGLAMLLF